MNALHKVLCESPAHLLEGILAALLEFTRGIVKIVFNLFTHGAPRSSQELVQRCPYISGSNWNLEMLVFKERGKPEYLEKNLSE